LQLLCGCRFAASPTPKAWIFAVSSFFFFNFSPLCRCCRADGRVFGSIYLRVGGRRQSRAVADLGCGLLGNVDTYSLDFLRVVCGRAACLPHGGCNQIFSPRTSEDVGVLEVGPPMSSTNVHVYSGVLLLPLSFSAMTRSSSVSCSRVGGYNEHTRFFAYRKCNTPRFLGTHPMAMRSL